MYSRMKGMQTQADVILGAEREERRLRDNSRVISQNRPWDRPNRDVPAQSQDALQAFSDAVTEAVNLIENAVNKVGMERVGTVVNRVDIGTIGPEGGVALQPWEVTVGRTDAGLWGFGTDVLATTVYGRFQSDKVTQSGFFRNERTGRTLLVPEAEYIVESIISLEIRADYDNDYNHFLATEAVGNYSYPLRPENQVGQSKILNYKRLD